MFRCKKVIVSSGRIQGPQFCMEEIPGPILSTPYTQHELAGWGEKSSTKRKIQIS